MIEHDAEKQAHMSLMGKLWGFWIGVFLFFEIYAILKEGGTLSTFVRRFFQVSKKQPLKYRAPRWVLTVLIIWLAIHLGVR